MSMNKAALVTTIQAWNTGYSSTYGAVSKIASEVYTGGLDTKVLTEAMSECFPVKEGADFKDANAAMAKRAKNFRASLNMALIRIRAEEIGREEAKAQPWSLHVQKETGMLEWGPAVKEGTAGSGRPALSAQRPMEVSAGVAATLAADSKDATAALQAQTTKDPKKMIEYAMLVVGSALKAMDREAQNELARQVVETFKAAGYKVTLKAPTVELAKAA